jgi:hypothetical protein
MHYSGGMTRQLNREQIEAGDRPVGRPLTRREAKYVSETDALPYLVVMPSSRNARGELLCETWITVTGYTSARVIAGKAPGAMILNEREAHQLRKTRGRA